MDIKHDDIDFFLRFDLWLSVLTVVKTVGIIKESFPYHFQENKTICLQIRKNANFIEKNLGFESIV